MFGESPPETPSAGNQSKAAGLFGDDSSNIRAATSSGLFEDSNNNTTDDSPWSLPTPKKQNRSNFVKTLLPASQVPDSYVNAYDNLLSAGEGQGNGVSLSAVHKVLQSSQIKASDQDRILSIVLPSKQESTSALERGEFNVLLALVGLAQEEEDIGLDAVDERRKREFNMDIQIATY